MKTMKTLTVNGVTYTVADPDSVSYTAQDLTDEQKAQARENIGAAQIHDAKTGADAWSSQKISDEMGVRISSAEVATVDKLAPAFAESGSVVACEPVEGYPLQVVSHIGLVQAGEGEPSLTNIRPITGHSAVKLYRNDEEFTIDLGQNVYGGSLDWQTGVLTLDAFCEVLDGVNKKFTAIGSVNGCVYALYTTEYSAGSVSNPICSHLKPRKGAIQYGSQYMAGVNADGHFACIQDFATVEEANAWLVKQADKGTPYTFCYPLREPIAVQLTPQEILAVSGENVLYSDTGDTDVSGKADPTAVIEKLTNAIIALGGNI